MSLAKYLFICDNDSELDVNDEEAFFTHFYKKLIGIEIYIFKQRQLLIH